MYAAQASPKIDAARVEKDPFRTETNYTDSSWMKKTFESCKPSVRRHWLLFAAGVVWLAVGIGLISVASYWLYHSAWPLSLVLGALSIALGLIVYSVGFSRIIRKNLDRISGKPEEVCLFAFQAWRSYFLILLMILMGYTLRHSPVPKTIDAMIYLTMGSALICGSSLYFREFSAKNAG